MVLSFEEILQRVEKEISSLELNFPPASLYTPIEYILSLGGKRIRPALALIACNIYSDHIESAIKPALGIEVFHNFTLLHDDLMDQADLRRNQQTVHKKWGDNTAILSGDAMLIVAYKLIGETPPNYLKPILDLFTKTAMEICGGQQYDMEFESRTNVREEEYMEMIRLKTAVLLGCSLKMGALTGGASEKEADLLYQYGIHIGLAFQLMDDLLDVYGDTASFGKKIGGDILCNKKTFLLINAFKHASGQQKEKLNHWIAKKEYDPAEKISQFIQIYNELQVKEITEKKIQYYYNQATECLKGLTIPQARLQTLIKVSELLMNRKS
ncbi:MAG: polyprenyl synthetase family protein [Tannerellaceae bacterium]|nr:polyprenyl synthetase family protein [Tannerellaceae bacterium]